MSQTYSYDIAADTPNGKVNPDIFHQELLDAALGSGGTLENVATENGTDLGNGVVQGGTLKVTWQNALSAGDEAAQDAVVAATQGDAFGPNVQRKSDEGVDTTTQNTFQVKVSGTALPLPAGKYLIAAYCEIKVSAVVANSGVRARVMKNAVEIAEDNWGESQWHSFSGAGIVDIKAGETPMMAIEYERIGVLNTVEIRRARISMSQQSG